MAMRKEQVLAIVVLLLAAWVYSGLEGGGADGRPFAPKKLEYTAAAVREAALAGGPAGAFRRADLFTEPRETRALPPRELAFPPHAPLSLATLPLDPGPDLAHALLLRDDGASVAGVTIQTGAETGAAAPEAGTNEPPAVAPQGGNRAALALTYDQLFLHGMNAAYFGFVEVDGMTKFEAEKLTNFEGRVVRFRQYSEATRKLAVRPDVYDDSNPAKVKQIRLANTLQNEVTRRTRDVPPDAAHSEQRAALIAWLLATARDAAWVYDEALEQARSYSQYSGDNLEGLRWQLRVLQAKGDLAGELALLEGITGQHRETAFRYEGLGVVKHKLGLYLDAEQDLRRAVELGRTDARPHAALAEFLRERGRSREAAAAVARAEAALSGVLDPSDKLRAVRAIVGCHLALGKADAARAVLKQAPEEQPYLAGCIAYVTGELPLALGAFRQASAGADGAAALLGQAAVLLRQQQWQEAHDAFLAVADRAPLLRHRAWSGLALLYQRIGQFDQSLVWAERALEAAPRDAYSLYVRGRTQRLQGNLAAAEESLLATLRLQDDFVHAIAEMAAVQQQKAQEVRGEEQAAAVLRAMRYGDRTVALANVPLVELYERKGLYQFAAGNRDAGETFAQARDAAARDQDRLFARGAIAICDYSRGNVDDAAAALQRFSELPKDEPMRKWAEATLQAIDDHAQKEMLEDRFERREPGGIWPGEKDGQTGAAIVDNRLVFRGPLTRTGQGEVWAERAGAVRGKNFLAVGCTLQLAKDHPQADSFAGLRIETQKGGNGQQDFQVQVGIRFGKPHLRIVDNREEPKLFDLPVAGFDPLAVQDLELRVVPRGDAQGRQFGLQVRWNGVVLHEQDLKSLGGSTGGELRTVLFVSGSRGNKVDVAFDDYRLERRKER